MIALPPENAVHAPTTSVRMICCLRMKRRPSRRSENGFHLLPCARARFAFINSRGNVATREAEKRNVAESRKKARITGFVFTHGEIPPMKCAGIASNATRPPANGKDAYVEI